MGFGKSFQLGPDRLLHGIITGRAEVLSITKRIGIMLLGTCRHIPFGYANQRRMNESYLRFIIFSISKIIPIMGL